MRINYRFLLCVIVLLPIHFLNAKDALEEPDVPHACNPIFSIGELNESSFEFAWEGFRYVQEVVVDADGIVDPTKIPGRLIHPDSWYSPDRWDAVKEITINFKVLDEESGLFLRIARSGDSDTLVVIDEMNEYRVTAEMLGSGEDAKFGAYDLHLGTLNKGNHNILLTMPDDGLGSNGSIKWDAIILCKE
jgi:hypothetical protein